MAAFSEFTPDELREKSRLTIAAARNEPNLLLKQAMAALAFDMAMHAEDIERRAARQSATAPQVPAGGTKPAGRPSLHQEATAEAQVSVCRIGSAGFG